MSSKKFDFIIWAAAAAVEERPVVEPFDSLSYCLMALFRVYFNWLL
jgi:hypothetical protein